MSKNLCGKTVKEEDAYEVWQSRDGSWKWFVLKKWQADDEKPYARWFVKAYSPFCPEGEMGDEYVSEIKKHGIRIK